MIKIDRLTLRLPRGFELRANAIARQIGDGLNHRNLRRSVNIDRLHVPPVSVSPHEGDGAVARKVVDAILQGIEGRRN